MLWLISRIYTTLETLKTKSAKFVVLTNFHWPRTMDVDIGRASKESGYVRLSRQMLI